MIRDSPTLVEKVQMKATSSLTSDLVDLPRRRWRDGRYRMPKQRFGLRKKPRQRCKPREKLNNKRIFAGLEHDVLVAEGNSTTSKKKKGRKPLFLFPCIKSYCVER